ncbi:MAG TPA: hypothetical protein VJN96_23285 [Vicinamibacterales bacterium]|nr:hypothetical protein [Vicinamibacterales bacterium]
MTANASRDLLYFVTGLIVVVRTYQLTRMDWSRPLKHGPGFFLAFEVPPGFYEGDGVAWLGRYRTALVAEYAVEWIALAALVATGHWQWLPVWAGGSAAIYVGSLGLFASAAGRALGGAGTQPAVAFAFETRRVRDYLSWPVETLIAALLVSGWLLLVVQGDADVRWREPVILTYVAVMLLVAKVVQIRAAAPLPTDRTDEHYRYFDAGRRQSLRVIDAARWFFVFVFCAYAVLHRWSDLRAGTSLQWLLVGAGVAIWLAQVATTITGVRRLEAMGRELRPPASWAGPFRSSPRAVRGAGVWAVSFVAGLATLFVML